VCAQAGWSIWAMPWAQGHRLQTLLQPAVTVDDEANDGQAAGRGVDFSVALLQDERHRKSHLLGEMTRTGRCAISLDQGAAKCDCGADDVTDSGQSYRLPSFYTVWANGGLDRTVTPLAAGAAVTAGC
jgi:hypothetical protein